MPIIPWEQVARGSNSDTDTFCCEEHFSVRSVYPLVGYRTVNCQEFQELITPAVDHRLTRDEMRAFQEHAGFCSACRREFESELATKALVRRKVKMVKAPSSLVASINDQIRRQAALEAQAAQPRAASRSRSHLLITPLVLFLVTAAAVAFLLSHEPGDSRVSSTVATGAPHNDIITRSLANYHAVQKGDITPQVTSSSAEQVHKFFSGKTSFPVYVLPIQHYTLVGGVLNDYAGAQFAHLVYRRDSELLYIFQIARSEVRDGTPLTLPPDAQQQLQSTGRFVAQRPDGDAVVLWTRGATLCGAVAHLNPADLVSHITQAEHLSVTPQ